jgi:hypothetical protein
VLFDPESKLSDLYKVEGMPFSVVIDKKGQVRYIHKGYSPGDEKKYAKYIMELVSE